MPEEALSQSRVAVENRQLRAALEELIQQIESGSPDMSTVRDKMPSDPGDKDPIQPPWEREGYDSKQAWLDDQ